MKLPPAKKKQAPPSNLEKGFPVFSNRLIYTTVFVFFISCFFCVNFGFRTLIGLFDVIKLLALSIVTAILLQRAFFKSVFPMNNAERYAFSIFGLGPALFACFLVLNFGISVRSETTNHLVFESYVSAGSIYFKAEGLPCDQYPEFCSMFLWDDLNFKAGDTISVTLEKGIGGYYVMKKIDALKKPVSSIPE
ncbi:MAG TPA: hypothetical protein DCX54_12105 [Flavobacteriales bacterium]|nr:hypothetical protein [Flavobacteriales bacterium]